MNRRTSLSMKIDRLVYLNKEYVTDSQISLLGSTEEFIDISLILSAGT